MSGTLNAARWAKAARVLANYTSAPTVAADFFEAEGLDQLAAALREWDRLRAKLAAFVRWTADDANSSQHVCETIASARQAFVVWGAL